MLDRVVFEKSKFQVEAVASYEWGRYDVIGGNTLHKNNSDNDDGSFIFHLGCVTQAISENKYRSRPKGV